MPANNVTVTANYSVSSYTVTVNGDYGTESGGGNFNVGETVALSASPDAGYTFSSWTVNSGDITLQTEDAWVQVGGDINGEAAGDLSGENIAFSADGSIVAISGTWNDGAGNFAGHVRVFRNESGDWVQIGTDIDGPGLYHEFGYSVAISADGNIVAIGTENFNISGSAGYVKVYENVSDSWVQISSDMTGAVSGERFGSAVALSSDGSILAVGARAGGPGSVRVYQNVSNSWNQIGSPITGEASSDEFGGAIAISSDGTVVAIGARLNDENGNMAGHVQVYRNVSGSWQKIGSDIDGEATGDQFGNSVALSSDGLILAIGGYLNSNPNANYSGHVRVYRNSSDNWVQIGSDIDGEAQYDEFGKSVSLSADGNILAVGATDNDGYTNNAGLVRVYQNISDNWTQFGLDIYGATERDHAGRSVALSSDGTKVAVGSPGNDENGNDAGQVRVFSYNTAGSFTMPANNVTVTANYSAEPSDLLDNDGDNLNNNDDYLR